MADATRRPPTGIARAVLAFVVAWLGLLLIVPLLALSATVVSELSVVVAALSRGPALRALAMTAGIAAVCVVLNGIFGVLGAIVLVRHRFWLRGLLDALVELPLALSPVMTGLAFLLLVGRQGLLRPVLDATGWQVAYAWPGVLLATLFVTLPFTLREVALVLEELGTTEEQAAATLGASGWQTFRYVTLPNVRGGVVLGATLTLARALGEFGAVLVVGGGIEGRTQTATTFIHAAVEERGEPAAFGMALLLASMSVLLLRALHREEEG